MADSSRLAEVLKKVEHALVADWLTVLKATDSAPATDLEVEATTLLHMVAGALPHGDNIDGSAWGDVRQFLDELSRSRTLHGFSSSETAMFVFSLRQPLLDHLRREYAHDPSVLAETTCAAVDLVDALGLYTISAFQKTREAIIIRQQEELLELSTPVVKLWDGVLALPMIGTLDSARTQIVMESLLQRIVETGAEVAIIDITGVPTVDTLVAQYLLKTVTAIRLMGADCIISGIRPQIAQTIVHLGIDLRGVVTKATMADALALALDRSGMMVVNKPAS